MSLPLVALAAAAVLALGYRFWGARAARVFALDDARPTPAVRLADGRDFVPTRRFYLLGQHFSAIAAAGPIAGPILACQAFGWLPCLLWIALGAVFVGAVHDLSALVASVRHQGRSVAELARENLGSRAWLALMAFIWLALLYVIVAFADVTAATFVGRSEELEGAALPFNQGGAVALASLLYLGLALLLGAAQRLLARGGAEPSGRTLAVLTLVFVPATLAAVWAGTRGSTLLVLAAAEPQKLWAVAILVYCGAASLLPVWLLLQPRGYLGGFVLYLSLAVGAGGILLGGFEVKQEAFKGWTSAQAGPLFPFLFVTIACGACSGFHGLVCSGTTSKQIAREGDCRPVGYGGMLLEGLVAVIALTTVMVLAPGEVRGGPGVVYGSGLGDYLTVFLGEEHRRFARTFGMMAFSTFVFDTLDVATRLGRYVLQELFGLRGRWGGLAAVAATLALPLYVLAGAPPPAPGARPAYMAYWTLFGTSNQLLAALTLLAVAVWLKRTGRPLRFTLLPMLFVLAATLWSLVLQARSSLGAARAAGRGLDPTTINGVVAVVLVVLAAVLALEALRAVRGRPAPAVLPPPPPGRDGTGGRARTTARSRASRPHGSPAAETRRQGR